MPEPMLCHAAPHGGPLARRANLLDWAGEAETGRSLCGKIGFVPERTKVDRSPELRPARVRTEEFRTPSGSQEATPVDDGALARAGMLGQAWAHREMWFRFAPMVFGFLRRALGGRRDHEDLLQEVFLRVFRRLDTLENPAALRSFVYSFAIRVVREELRRHRIRGRFASLFAPAAEPSVPHVDFESRELLRRVEAALGQLPDRRRTIFVLRRFDGMELAEIAVSLDLSLATVKRDLDRANQQIATSIHRDDRLRAGLEADLTPSGGSRARATEGKR
jgi:RNA polymerase sigma-70 factor, ECF subfamily